MNTILTRHININGTNVTIAGKQDPSTSTLILGVARCGSKDSFSKRKGNLIAQSRANKHPFKHVKVVNKSNFNEAAMEIAKKVAEDPSLINGRLYKTKK